MVAHAFRLALWAALFSVALCQTLPFSDNATSMVKELDSESFLEVYSSEPVNLVLIYDPKEEKSKDFAAVWESIATEHAGIFQFGAIDGTGQMNWLLETIKVKKMPSLLAFPSKLTTSKTALPSTYKGGMNQTAINKWVVKQLPYSLITKITSDSSMSSFKGGVETAKVCLFHNESDTPAVFRSLSLGYNDRLSFGEVKVQKPKVLKIATAQEVTSFPTLVVYSQLDAKVKTVYDSTSFAIADVAEFLEPHALSLEARDEIRKARKEKYEREEKERAAKAEEARLEREAKKKAEAAEKKRRRREKRKIVKAIDEALTAREKEWESQDGEYIQVRATGWDDVPDAAILKA